MTLQWHTAWVKRAVFHIHAVYTSLHFAHVSSSAAPASGIIRETQTYVINRKTENRTQKGGFPVNQVLICFRFSVRESGNPKPYTPLYKLTWSLWVGLRFPIGRLSMRPQRTEALFRRSGFSAWTDAVYRLVQWGFRYWSDPLGSTTLYDDPDLRRRRGWPETQLRCFHLECPRGLMHLQVLNPVANPEGHQTSHPASSNE